jgi:hypothetical protein
MRSGILLTLLLLAVVPLWAQTDSQSNDEEEATTNSSIMIAPPPVSGQAYPAEVGAERRSNYVDGGLTVGGGYLRNLYVGGATGVADEGSLSIRPDISLDEATSRQHLRMKYSPSFNFYEPASSLNATDQSFDANYLFHPMPHVTISADNNFQKASVLYNSSSFTGRVSPSPPPLIAGAVPVLAHWTGNTVQAVLNWQYARSAMTGVSGSLAMMRFSNPSDVTGLFNSDSRGGSGFWALQLSERQYVGTVYQFFDILARPSNPQTETQTHTFYAFYTRYLTRRFSASVSAGPQHYRVNQSSGQLVQAWSPAVMASLGWQSPHTSLSISYDRTVTGGGGLLGAYHEYGANASARWQMTRTWTASLIGGYASNKSVFSGVPATSPFFNTDGHMASGGLSVQHWLTEHIALEGEYDRIHQSYGSIPAIAKAPDSDRATVSVAWRFTQLLGR